ncbi:MAG TPA: beta-propeller fold lactonase family protein [Stellaceae bacterium]|nr:beta-propeller fold lactonase family protein [Stellaceae bacterium]
MPDLLYVGLQDDDKIAVFAIDSDSGRLTMRAEVAGAGGPSVFAISPDRKTLYVGHRTRPSIAGFRIDPATGGLSLSGTAPQADAPTFLAPDRTGRYLLSAYYQGGYAAVYPIAADGTVGASPVDKQETAIGAHAIATDPSNRYAFVPHISRIQDNVLEPPKNNPGPNFIMQFRFDAQSGRLTPNSPSRVEQGDLVGPRHYICHPSLDVVYFSNEQGCSVTAYRLDRVAGTLSAVQTISTLPAGHSERTTCSQIHLTPSGRFLYVGNRAASSSNIAGFAVDPASGQLSAAGHVATEAVPSAFCLDPAGRFLFAVGTASGRLASYRIEEKTGALTPLGTQPVGQRPAAVLAVRLGA